MSINNKKTRRGQEDNGRGGGEEEGEESLGKYSYPSNISDSMYCPIPMYIKDQILLHNNTKRQRNIYV